MYAAIYKSGCTLLFKNQTKIVFNKRNKLKNLSYLNYLKLPKFCTYFLSGFHHPLSVYYPNQKSRFEIRYFWQHLLWLWVIVITIVIDCEDCDGNRNCNCNCDCDCDCCKIWRSLYDYCSGWFTKHETLQVFLQKHSKI